MRTRRWMMPLGMLAVAVFLCLTLLGSLLWPGYSAVISSNAPNEHLTRTFMHLYNIFFCVYTMAMSVYAYRNYRNCLRVGFTILFAAAFLSLLGYGTVPIGIEMLFVVNNLFHFAITITILILTIIALFLISYGYWKQEGIITLGKFSLIISCLFVALNLWHLTAILTAQPILGLVQRLTFYTAHAFTFVISWVYTFRLRLRS